MTNNLLGLFIKKFSKMMSLGEKNAKLESSDIK